MNGNDQPTLSEEVPKKYRIINFLLKNHTDLHCTTIMNEFSISMSALSSFIRRVNNQNIYKITRYDGLLKIRIKGRLPTTEDIYENINDGNEIIGLQRIGSINKLTKTNQENTEMPNQRKIGQERQNKLIKLLTDNPNGLNTEEIISEIKIKNNQLYSLIFGMKKKLSKQNKKIINTGDRYKLINLPENNNSEQPQNITTPQVYQKKIDSNLIPPDYISMFENLPDSDKIDCIDMLKKSVYYQKAAIALIESNQIAFNFCKTLNH